MRVNRHTGVYVSFVGNIFQIAYCYVHHTMVRVNRHTGVYVSFFGNIFQIAYCYVHHTLVGTIWLAVVAICSNYGNLF